MKKSRDRERGPTLSGCSIKKAACFEVVQAAGGIHEAVDDDLCVGATVAGIDTMSGNCIAQGLHGGVIVAECLHKNGFEFPRASSGTESGADPAVIGAQTAAGSFRRGMENSHVTGSSQLCDEALIFCDREARVAHVRKIDEELEVVAAKFFVDRLDESPSTLDVGESLEFDGTKEFDVPCGDRRIEQARFFYCTHMEFHILRNGGFEIHIDRTVHPLLNRSRGHRYRAVFDGGFERRHELGDDSVFFGRVHRVRTTDHHDEVNFEIQGLEVGHHFGDVVCAGAGEKRNLHASRTHGSECADAIHLRDDRNVAIFFTRERAIRVWRERINKPEVGGNETESNLGFE